MDTLVAKAQLRIQTSPIHKDNPQLYGGDLDEDEEEGEEEEVMAALCHSGETYSVI